MKIRDWMKFFAMMLLGVMLTAGSCDEESDDENGDESGDESGDKGASVDGPCSEANAATTCGDDCEFDPAEIDCTAACQKVIDICANDPCDDVCENSVYTDANLCALGCESTKTMSCTNVTFGCYDSEDTCEAIGTCVNDLM